MYRLCFTWWHISAILFQAEQVAYVVIIQFSSLDLYFFTLPKQSNLFTAWFNLQSNLESPVYLWRLSPSGCTEQWHKS